MKEHLHVVNIVVLILLFSLAIQTVTSSVTKSLTYDEPKTIYKAYYSIKTWDFGLIAEHTPLIFLISGTPLLFLDVNLPTQLTDSASENAYQFLYVVNNNTDEIIFWSRIPILFLSILLGIYIFIWAKELYGKNAGLFALFLYSFNPNILAHSGLMTTDIGITAFMFIAVYYFWRYIKKPTRRGLFLAGITFGLAQLAKTVALFLIPIYLIIILLIILKKKKAQISEFKLFLKPLIIIFLIGILIINAGYLFYGTFTPLITDYKDHPALDKILPKDQTIRNITYSLLRAVPLPLPKYYVQGLGAVFAHSVNGHSAFLMGQYSQYGWWYYFPIAFLIKNPVPLFLFIALCIIFCKIKKYDLFLLIPFLIIIIAFMFGKINIGLRYILPAFPFLFVLISRIINIKKLITLVLLLSIWYALSSILIWPHYLAYFNEIVGGPDNGYKYLVDSNLDWSQDLKGLASYMKKNKIDIIKLNYFGTAEPNFYNISYQQIGCEPTTGILAVSATNLQLKDRQCLEWLKSHTPVDKIGYSIFIYNITD